MSCTFWLWTKLCWEYDGLNTVSSHCISGYNNAWNWQNPSCHVDCTYSVQITDAQHLEKPIATLIPSLILFDSVRLSVSW
jgi:hypothetical protein